MKAITVCVEYDDLLAITLPVNAVHFEEIIVVTAPGDDATLEVVSRVKNACPFITDAFYRNRAVFNKGLALEEGFDELGRSGWIVVCDCDIVMPDPMPLADIYPGHLYAPRRRMLYDLSQWNSSWNEVLSWSYLPHHPDREFAGYFQLFHADDPALVNRPWYPTNWRHAGGCDSEFHQKWLSHLKIRPGFEVLHLGQDGVNWCGRTTEKMDGTKSADAITRKRQLENFISSRKRGKNKFQAEKL